MEGCRIFRVLPEKVSSCQQASILYSPPHFLSHWIPESRGNEASLPPAVPLWRPFELYTITKPFLLKSLLSQHPATTVGKVTDTPLNNSSLLFSSAFGKYHRTLHLYGLHESCTKRKWNLTSSVPLGSSMWQHVADRVVL